MRDGRLKWELVTSGKNPPPGTSYNKWIQCEPIFSGITDPDDCQAEDPVDVMWAPRRGHAAVVFKGFIYVLGGKGSFCSSESVKRFP
jgi:hypothetical protein